MLELINAISTLIYSILVLVIVADQIWLFLGAKNTIRIISIIVIAVIIAVITSIFI